MTTLAYFALYEQDVHTPPPRGIAITDEATWDALLWDHARAAWVYAPEKVNRFLDNPLNLNRYLPLDRAEAERITPGITGADELPDEETIRWIFEWKGEPPGVDRD
jgi:hypothetical protein